MIKIVDYKMGNVLSLYNLFRRIGKKPQICVKPEQLNGAKYIVLPGIGNFDDSVTKLKKLGFYHKLNKLVLKKKTMFLGICVGMQLLFDQSEEGSKKGFGWISGKVKKFDVNNSNDLNNKKIPHIGWRSLQLKKKNQLFDMNINRYYFLHSYYVKPKNKKDILTTTNYGFEFASAVQKKNIMGFQFHPEKSLNSGVNLFKKIFNGYE